LVDRPRFRVRRWIAPLAVLVSVSCREIPPRLPEGYLGGPSARGWPPAAVYHPDPFHPANRLHQRLFLLSQDPPPPPSSSLPSPAPRSDLDPLDRAEIDALLERSLAPSSTVDALAPASRARLRADLEAAAAALRARGPDGEAGNGAWLEALVARSAWDGVAELEPD
jgi:hypothetical protein